MKIILILLLFCSLTTQAQNYKPTTTQKDSFSIALIKLLNCAAERFSNCKGSFIRSTWLMGDDHELTFPFPGSAKAIVRIRDWDKNAYIEFRGFADRDSRLKGEKELIKKIKKTLGEQLYDSYEKGLDSFSFHGLSVRDKDGFFSQNMEVFSSSSSADIYLLGPEKEEDKEPKKHFILLKIYSGIPYYNYFIRKVPAPDAALDATVKYFINASENDFDSIRYKNATGKLLRKKRDTLHIGGNEIFLSYRGAYHSASLQFPITSSANEEKQWNYYQQVVQAALGEDWVYYISDIEGQSSILYYNKSYISGKPRIRLETGKDQTGTFITLKIESSYSHPVSRALQLDDE